MVPSDPSRDQDAIAVSAALRALRWPLVGIFLLISIAALAYARMFLMPVVLAILLALVFAPLRRFLERIGFASPAAAATILFGFILGISVIVASVAVPASEWIKDAPQILRKVEWKFQDLRPTADRLREIENQINDIVSPDAPPATGETARAEDLPENATQDASGSEGENATIVVAEPKGEFQGLGSTLALAPPVIAQLVFTLLLLFFLLGSGDMFLEKVVQAAPTKTEKRRVVEVVFDIERKLSRYLFTITLINAALGASIGIAMWLLGMPNPLLFAVIGFLFNFAPYIGALAGTGIAMAVGIVSLDTLWAGVGAGAIYFALTSIEGQLVTPWFVGRNLRLNTVVVFVSVMFWAWLWSAVGILVATPLLVALRVLCDHIPSLAPIGAMLSERDRPGDRAAPAPGHPKRQ